MSKSETVEFPSALFFIKRDPITLIELRMRQLSGKIRSKPNWWDKVNDDAIAAKWRQEIVDQDRELVEVVKKWWARGAWYDYEEEEAGERKYGPGKYWPRDQITEQQLNYIFDELRYDASRRDPDTNIFETGVQKVFESRSLISSALKEELIRGVSVLENVPEEEKDWHPGSNKQVLDLVHPSLYCLRIGESYIRQDGAAKAEIITEDAYMKRPDLANYKYDNYTISSEYQWLPTDFEVSKDGSVNALSYINNLHPTRHRALYPPITSVLARFIPLFENVLGAALVPERPVITPNPIGWYDHIKQPDFGNDWEGQEAWREVNRWPLIPEPGPFEPPSEPTPFLLKGRTVQVIVKLANIVLTPERPTYPGGAWHVEGMANERIVATGLYYYACENITESRLDFRMSMGTEEEAEAELEYEQSDSRGYIAAYGFGGNDYLNQRLGHVVAEEDKCIAFPNVYQHHVDSFELVDKSKPGYRKILCFFLVDPTIKILSTTNVPPQQEDWSMDELAKAPAMQKLPVELFDMVTDYVQGAVISRKSAEEDREELMKERSKFSVTHNAEVFQIEFNMCEH